MRTISFSSEPHAVSVGDVEWQHLVLTVHDKENPIHGQHRHHLFTLNVVHVQGRCPIQNIVLGSWVQFAVLIQNKRENP